MSLRRREGTSHTVIVTVFYFPIDFIHHAVVYLLTEVFPEVPRVKQHGFQ